MRRLLVLTATAALLLVVFYTRPARPQELYQHCTEGLPSVSDFPDAAPTCKDPRRLAPWVGTPDVVFTVSARCVLTFTTCGGDTKCYKSEIRTPKAGFCDTYWERANLLSKTICCDPKCEKYPPWFDGLSPDPKCKNRQEPVVTDDGQGWVYLEMCGWKVFAHNLETTDPLFVRSHKAAVLEYVRKMVGSTVCCDSFTAAARPGSTCDPRFDLDCDGILNTTDHHGEHRDSIRPGITTFGIAPGVRGGDTNPLPPWFQPGDKGFMPPANLCDCKWEMMKGTRTCSPDGKARHVYQARWRCPSTGNERFTRKEAPASEPCGPGSETAEFFRPRSTCPEPQFHFTSTFFWPTRGS